MENVHPCRAPQPPPPTTPLPLYNCNGWLGIKQVTYLPPTPTPNRVQVSPPPSAQYSAFGIRGGGGGGMCVCVWGGGWLDFWMKK